MPKRRERVAPPPAAQGWDFRYATNDAARGWTQTCATAPGNARAAWEAITSDPRRHSRRQHPLKGPTSQRSLAGVEMDQWQYEVTSGGRIWYCIDDGARTIWMTEVHIGHPKATE